MKATKLHPKRVSCKERKGLYKASLLHHNSSFAFVNSLEPRVLLKQPLYVHEVRVRFAYTLASPGATLSDFTGYVIIVV